MLQFSRSRLAVALAATLLATVTFALPILSSGPLGVAPAYADNVPEKDAFNAAKELGTVDAWQAFLNNYPDGFHADLARAYIKNLGGGGAAADPAPATPVLDDYPLEAGSWGGIVRSGPAKGYPQQDSLGEGEAVTLMGVAPGLDGGYPWFKIAYGPNGIKGYMWGGILCSKTGPRADLFQTCPDGGGAVMNPPANPAPANTGGQRATNAPSWCRGPTNGAERTICSDYRLSALDRQLNDEFQMAVSNITSAAVGGTKADVSRFRNEQQAWLNQRNSCGTDLPCIQSMYQSRLKAVRDMNQPE